MTSAARRRRAARRWALALFGAVIGAPAVAHADPAGPTDYISEIVGVAPAAPVIDVSIEGGDAFVHVEVEPGHEVVVLGYSGEPYLRISADGSVEQNVRSSATYENAERYGVVGLPEIVDDDAPPEWERVGDGGAWSWHDHRAHWMGTEPPLNMEPGESLPVQRVELLVDGTPVEVSVRTTLQAPPSFAVPLLGALAGLGLGAIALRLGPASRLTVLVPVSIGALAVGVGQFTSLPPSTGRALSWWLLPAIAAVAAVVAIATYGRSTLVRIGLTALAGAQLSIWAVQRRSGLSRAVLPTSLPPDLDRFVTAATLLAAGLVLVGALTELARVAGVGAPTSTPATG